MNCRALCNSNLNLTYRWSLEYYSNRAIVRHSRTEFHPPPLIGKNSLEWDICPTVWNEKRPYFKNLEKMLETVFNKDLGCTSCFQTIHGLLFQYGLYRFLLVIKQSIFKIYVELRMPRRFHSITSKHNFVSITEFTGNICSVLSKI